MKKNIHPQWVNATMVCACGNTFESRSIKPMLKVELCSQCHPFFTGQQRIVDTGGQVERFMRRLSSRQAKADASSPDAKSTATTTS